MMLTLDKFIDDREELKLMKSVEILLKAGDRRAIVDWALYSVLALSGLRISEALALRWDRHVGPDYLMVFAEDSKSGKPRSVIMGKRLIRILAEFRKINPYPDSPYLFNTQKGQYSRTNAHDRLKYWLSVAGLRDSISCHSFRHSYATRLLDAGVSLTLVRDQLGHSSIAVTSVYLHFTRASKDILSEAV